MNWTVEQDQQRRNNWLRRMKISKVGSSVLVGDYEETLADVVRWLDAAVAKSNRVTLPPSLDIE